VDLESSEAGRLGPLNTNRRGIMSDGREEREEREARIEQEKQEKRDDRVDHDDVDEWEPERVDS